MVLRHFGKRRRLLGHVVTCFFLVFLLYKLSTKSAKSTNLTSHSEKSEMKVKALNELPSEDVQFEVARLFKKADTTSDGKLSKKELAWSISKSVEGHLVSALRNNFRNFFSLDKINHNGQVEWEEWLQEFTRKSKASGESPSDRLYKERLAAAKAAWSEAARSNPDSLNIDEFLAFTHPESSHSILAQEAEDLFARHDVNGDSLISETEYLTDPYVDMEEDEVEERRRTFREAMDANKDGKADKREVLTYLDPKHPYRSQEEASRLIAIADLNGDELLEISEVMNHAIDFLESRWANPEKVFHGDL